MFAFSFNLELHTTTHVAYQNSILWIRECGEDFAQERVYQKRVRDVDELKQRLIEYSRAHLIKRLINSQIVLTRVSNSQKQTLSTFGIVLRKFNLQ